MPTDELFVVVWIDALSGNRGTSIPLTQNAATTYAAILKSLGHRVEIEPAEKKGRSSR